MNFFSVAIFLVFQVALFAETAEIEGDETEKQWSKAISKYCYACFKYYLSKLFVRFDPYDCIANKKILNSS